MSTTNEAAIREQAYYFWEQDGRPDGRESEYWQRAVTALSATKVARKRSAKAVEAAPKAGAPKRKAAASSAKAAPVKTAKAAGKPAKAAGKPAKGEAAKKPKKK